MCVCVCVCETCRRLKQVAGFSLSLSLSHFICCHSAVVDVLSCLQQCSSLAVIGSADDASSPSVLNTFLSVEQCPCSLSSLSGAEALVKHDFSAAFASGLWFYIGHQLVTQYSTRTTLPLKSNVAAKKIKINVFLMFFFF